MVHGVARGARARPRRAVGGGRRDCGPASLAYRRSAPSSRELLPEACRGLWSYSNAGYVLAGEACAAAAGTSYSRGGAGARCSSRSGSSAPASRSRTAPLRDTSPRARPAIGRPGGRVSGVEAGGGRALVDGRRPASVRGAPARRAGTSVRGAARCVREPRADALGGRYCLGCWSRSSSAGGALSTTRGRSAATSRCSCSCPRRRRALAVLTNSWRGSGLIRRVVASWGSCRRLSTGRDRRRVEPGRYALGDAEAVLTERNGRWRVAESEDRSADRRADRATRVRARPARRRCLRLRRRVPHESPGRLPAAGRRARRLDRAAPVGFVRRAARLSPAVTRRASARRRRRSRPRAPRATRSGAARESGSQSSTTSRSP